MIVKSLNNFDPIYLNPHKEYMEHYEKGYRWTPYKPSSYVSTMDVKGLSDDGVKTTYKLSDEQMKEFLYRKQASKYVGHSAWSDDFKVDYNIDELVNKLNTSSKPPKNGTPFKAKPIHQVKELDVAKSISKYKVPVPVAIFGGLALISILKNNNDNNQ